MKAKEVYDFLDFIAPFNTAAEWDNCGLSVGSFEKEVSKIYIALDVTSEVIADAKNWGADLVVTHHPLIFNPVSSVEESTVLYKAVKSGMTFISSHTCLDKAVGGVNDCLAKSAGIKNLRTSEIDEFLKIGEIEDVTAFDFAKKIKSALGGKVTFTDCGKTIKTVALCSGSGGDLIEAAAKEGADAFLTGEAKHHEYLLSKELGVSLFAAGHYETENIVCAYLYSELSRKFEKLAEVKVSELPNPINYI